MALPQNELHLRLNKVGHNFMPHTLGRGRRYEEVVSRRFARVSQPCIAFVYISRTNLCHTLPVGNDSTEVRALDSLVQPHSLGKWVDDPLRYIRQIIKLFVPNLIRPRFRRNLLCQDAAWKGARISAIRGSASQGQRAPTPREKSKNIRSKSVYRKSLYRCHRNIYNRPNVRGRICLVNQKARGLIRT